MFHIANPRFYCHIVNGKPELKRVHLFLGSFGLGRIKVVLSSIF